MLRIRLPGGNIREFAGSEELSQAVTRGEVDRNAEIYHAKSGRWVSITGHPVFRRTEAPAPPQPEPEDRQAGDAPSAPELPAQPTVDAPPHAEAGVATAIPSPETTGLPLASQELEFAPTDDQANPPPPPEDRVAHPGSVAEAPREEMLPVAPKPDSLARPPLARPAAEPARAPHPVLAIQSKSGIELAARRRSRWRASTALFVVALALAGVLWVNREEAVEAPQMGLRTAPAARTDRASVPPAITPRDTGPAISPAPAEALAAVAPGALAGSHARLADSLDAELARTAKQLGLDGMLATERLASGDSVGASRAALSRFTASLATYRSRQQALSKAYNDSADLFVLAGAWDRGALQEWQVRVRRPEPPAVVARADLLVASLDSLFGLLLAYRDGYAVTADEIRFQAPRASLQYDELFSAVNSNRGRQSERLSVPLTVLVQAMAGSPLPRSAHD